MRFKKIKDEEPRLGITPLIDIVFLLLIFFMVTSHFHMASGISIKLPKVTQRAFNKDSEKITLMIDREGRTYLKGDIIDLKKLATELKRSGCEGGPDSPSFAGRQRRSSRKSGSGYGPCKKSRSVIYYYRSRLET